MLRHKKIIITTVAVVMALIILFLGRISYQESNLKRIPVFPPEVDQPSAGIPV